jgi:uroporphyrinogen-III synthase
MIHRLFRGRGKFRGNDLSAQIDQPSRPPLPLAQRRIVVPESRELKLFSDMLEAQGAEVVRCPMVAIADVEDFAPVDAWLSRLATAPPDYLILLTGEGVARLWSRAESLGVAPAVRAGMAAACKVVRGPKPIRALRQIGLNADVVAADPTTAGVIDALRKLPVAGRRVAIQLFPAKTGEPLLDFLADINVTPDPILPYRYAGEAEDEAVEAVIRDMAAGRVDVIAFTSAPQVLRLGIVAGQRGILPELASALARTKIASIGPVTTEAVQQLGGQVSIAPTENFHLKPLVNAIVSALKSG